MTTILDNIGVLATPLAECGEYEIMTVKDACIIIRDGKILFAGDSHIRPKVRPSKTIDCKGMLATPGLIDCHTHPAFAATREEEFHLRNTGVSYAEIAARGGGIRSSVRKLRAISEEKLVELMKKRFDGFLKLGTTTIDAKSGYGLSLEDELKSLRAIRALKDHPLEVSPTFLGAHEFPDEYRDNREGYIDLLINEMIPAVVSQKLADFCDIFVEKNVYTVNEARKILSAAKKAGLKLRLHVDQLSAGGGAELAAEVGAVSAEHLDFISEKGIDMMVDKDVIFNLLPGAVFFLGHDKYPPARKIIERGGKIALATDYNPGSSYTRSLPLMMTIAGSFMKMNADELLFAVTMNAARSLKRDDRIGSIEPGKQADIVLWDAPSHEYIPYHYGENLVRMVFKRGEIVHEVN